MKCLFVLITLFFCTIITEAQNMPYNTQYYNPVKSGDSKDTNRLSLGKGTNLLSSGIGIGGNYHSGSGNSSTPNFIFSYEKNAMFTHVGPGSISLGGLISYKNITHDNVNDNAIYIENWNYMVLAFRAAYHLNFAQHPKCDPYAGLMMSYYYITHDVLSNPSYNTSHGTYTFNGGNYTHYLAPSAFIGFRYLITNQLGLWAELSYGYTLAALGASMKF